MFFVLWAIEGIAPQIEHRRTAAQVDERLAPHVELMRAVFHIDGLPILKSGWRRTLATSSRSSELLAGGGPFVRFPAEVVELIVTIEMVFVGAAVEFGALQQLFFGCRARSGGGAKVGNQSSWEDVNRAVERGAGGNLPGDL